MITLNSIEMKKKNFERNGSELFKYSTIQNSDHTPSSLFSINYQKCVDMSERCMSNANININFGSLHACNLFFGVRTTVKKLTAIYSSVIHYCVFVIILLASQ